MNGYFNFTFFQYVHNAKGGDLPGIVAFGANDTFCCRRTQPLRKIWCCTSDKLRCVLAREYFDVSM